MQTFDAALDVLKNHQTSPFGACMEALRGINNVRGAEAEKALGPLIAVARDSKIVWLRHAALNRLQDMVIAQTDLPPTEQKLVTFDLVAAMISVLNDDDPKNFKDQAGGKPQSLRIEMFYAHKLAHGIIKLALQSSPNGVIRSYLESECEKHKLKHQSKQPTREESLEKLKKLKAHIRGRKPRVQLRISAPVEPALPPEAPKAEPPVQTPKPEMAQALKTIMQDNAIPSILALPSAPATPSLPTPTPPAQPRARIPTLDLLHFTKKPKL